jgi:threonine aldolase
MFKGIDLFSDTMTIPSRTMREAMMDAEVGDEQRGEDPTTERLEKEAAALLGLSSAIFLPSATMANEIAILLHCGRGDEVIAAENAHIFVAEAGGPGFHSGVQARPIETKNGIFDAESVRSRFRPFVGPHFPVSKLVVVENTTNMGGGIPWPIDTLNGVLKMSKELGLKTHLDGSRLLNASVKLNVSPKELAGEFDTVTLCLSKGLGCAVGALLAFHEKEFARVRRLKQVMGGAMRQSGILAAAGLYALENNIERLKDDHDRAVLLAKLISEKVPELVVENNPPETNMVFFRWQGNGPSEQFLEKCVPQGLRFSMVGENRFRAVTHLNIEKKDIERAVNIMKQVSSPS